MKNIDWHDGFVNAMKLELMENEEDLEFQPEQLIANRAQRIDLLIIKKRRDVPIVNEIGKLFDKFNIIEFKGPDEGLTLGDFYKVLAYTSIYLQELRSYDEYGRDAFTMTFVRRRTPVKLFRLLRRDGHKVKNSTKGLYEITGHIPFRTQIIVTRSWDDEGKEVHTWLRSMTKTSHGIELEGIISQTLGLSEAHKEYANNVMKVFAEANTNVVQKCMEGKTMSNILSELFADEIAAEKKRADEAVSKCDEYARKAKELEEENAQLKASRTAVIEEIEQLKASRTAVLEENAQLKAALAAAQG